MKIKIAERVQKVQYAIRDVMNEAAKVEASGKQVFKLNIGDPNAYDFDTPNHVKKSVYNAVENRNNGYCDSQGVKELREAISADNKRKGIDCSAENVIITSGLSEATLMLFGAMLEKGDNVLLPSPVYPQYEALAKFFDGEPRFYACDEQKKWKPDVDDLRKKIDSKTQAVLIINPNNPTGAVYDAKTLKEIIAAAGEHEIPVLSDEIYDRIIYDKPHASTASLTKDVPVITMNGLSKNYLAPGWRIGWITFNNFTNDSLKEAVMRLARARICAPTPFQHAAVNALTQENPEEKESLAKLRERRNLTYERLNEIPGLSCCKPEGAFYAFPQITKGPWKTDKEFVLQLLREKNVLTVWGEGFHEPQNTKHFRIVFLPEENILEKAFNAIEEFMRQHAN